MRTARQLATDQRVGYGHTTIKIVERNCDKGIEMGVVVTEGIKRAQEVIEDGSAARKLSKLISISNQV